MSETDPLVSVILIVKNGKRYIRSTLQSVFDQDYRPIEVIVVDGNSEDGTLKIVREFEDVCIINQRTSGIYNAFNIGIKAAKAPFIALLSSDDIWMSDKLSLQISFMIAHPEIMYTNTHFKYFLETGLQMPKGTRKEWFEGSHPGRIPETLVARKKVFDKVGYFKTAYSTAEDLDWFGRAQDLNMNSYMMKDVLLKKRIHDNNASMQIDTNTKNLLKILRRSVDRKKPLYK